MVLVCYTCDLRTSIAQAVSQTRNNAARHTSCPIRSAAGWLRDTENPPTPWHKHLTETILPCSTPSTPRTQRNIYVRCRSNWSPLVQNLRLHVKNASQPIPSNRHALCYVRTASSVLQIDPNRPNLPFRITSTDRSSRYSTRCTTS